MGSGDADVGRIGGGTDERASEAAAGRSLGVAHGGGRARRNFGRDEPANQRDERGFGEGVRGPTGPKVPISSSLGANGLGTITPLFSPYVW
jgi:hypothetical protein